jgi:iron complex outermembrane receptor protein
VSIAAIDESRTEGKKMGRGNGFFAGVIAAALWLFGSPTATGQEGATERTRSAMLEEIVVTAQKREQRYLDVPVSVSTFSGDTLDLAKVTEFQDLVQISPSVTFNQTGDQRGVGVLIRGIGTTAFQTAVEPTVSVVVDGVTLGRTVQFLSDLNDIERVEVLRGPQGTLFGKNASAGLINVITKRPSESLEGSFRSSVTDDDSYEVSGSISGPLMDNVRGRVSAYTKEYDGWGKNLFTGNDINGDESWGIRGKLDIDFSDTVNLYLIDASEQDRNCCSFLAETSGDRFVRWDYEQYGISLDNNEKNNVTLDAQDGFSNTDTIGLSGELTIDFEYFVLTSITAYRNFELETNQGIDGMPYDTPTYGRFLFNANGAFGDGNQEQDQFSQELRITTTGWDDVTLTAGLFYFDQTVDRYFYREALLCVAPSAGDTSLSPDPSLTPCNVFLSPSGFFDSTVKTENWAAFGQADWRFADRWMASLGLRYTEDDIAVDFVRETTPGPAVPPSSSGSNQVDDSDVTGKISLQYDATDEMMVYGSYSQGYKAPAFDLIFSATPERIAEAVPAEESEAWELGMKGEFFDERRIGRVHFDQCRHRGDERRGD